MALDSVEELSRLLSVLDVDETSAKNDVSLDWPAATAKCRETADSLKTGELMTGNMYAAKRPSECRRRGISLECWSEQLGGSRCARSGSQLKGSRGFSTIL